MCHIYTLPSCYRLYLMPYYLLMGKVFITREVAGLLLSIVFAKPKEKAISSVRQENCPNF